MALIKLNLATRSGLVTAAGIGQMIVGFIVQILMAAQAGELKTGLHRGFDALGISLPAMALIALGFLVMSGGILWGLFGEDKKQDYTNDTGIAL